MPTTSIPGFPTLKGLHMWVWLGLVSMVFLGVYDICKKHSLTGNAVLPTLFFSNLASVCLMLPILLLSHSSPGLMQSAGFYAAPMPLHFHGLMASRADISPGTAALLGLGPVRLSAAAE